MRNMQMPFFEIKIEVKVFYMEDCFESIRAIEVRI